MGLKEAFGNRIKSLRRQRGLTQDALAFRAERAVDTISLIERGVNWPNAETVEKLAEALGATINELFDDLPVASTDDGEDQLAVGRDMLKQLDDKDLALALVMLNALLQKKQ
ncbi:helix-turn-helix domain-containing protein [Mesorhizobium sp. M0563]|uniref:helix-turn-helix domain-containing protein n=1 Tax=Mesorhizobium sp. M0563 TaxID=2956959 RepID=UPI0033363BA6